jgi:TolB protein
LQLKNFVAPIFSLLFLLFSGPAWGRVYLDIDSPMLQKIPVSVADILPLTSGQSTPDNISVWLTGNLTAALEMTGLFQCIPREAFLEDQKLAPFSADAIHFEDWTAIGSEYVIKGRFSLLPGGKGIRISWRLFDAVQRIITLEIQCQGKFENRNELVYPFIDALLLAITGERGVFDTRIAFVQKKGTSSRVSALSFDGSGLTTLITGETLVITPRWSPDGKQMAYTSYQNGHPCIFLRSMDSGQVRKIASFSGINLAGPWSPDGRKLLMTLSKDGNEEIYVMDLQSGRLSRLTNHSAIDVSPSWSPDGNRIAFVSNRGGSPQIYVINADGSNVNRLTYDGSYNSSPAWSPRGNRIAYESRRNGFFQIHTMDINGSRVIQVTSEPVNHESPSWSPDGRYLAFGIRDGATYKICISNAGGTGLRVLYESKDPCRSPAWSPHSRN